jgi:Bacterial protein of unknown function (DUF839)
MRRTLVGLAAGAAAFGATAIAIAQISSGVPNPQPREGTPPNIFANGFVAKPVALGSDALENAIGQYAHYGFVSDKGLGSDAPTSGLDTKSEPDQNTYVVTSKNPGGPTKGYDYGRHFLIQGHEIFGGSNNNIDKAYLTRINLDVKDPKHRITLLIEPGAESNGVQSTGIRSIDGSNYDPYTGQLLFSAEAGKFGYLLATPLKWSGTSIPALTRLDGSIGNAGYEGVQLDKRGNLILIEDTGGSGVTDNGAATKVKQPNSFVYRFVPAKPNDLTEGRLQALQVSVDGTPITFHTGAGARDDALGAPIAKLHSGAKLPGQWVTIHDTGVDGTAPFDANAAAKAKGATPFKRPENGKFVPDTDFKSFVFDETGDTDNTGGTYVSPVDGAKASDRGAWGALLRISWPKSSSSDTVNVRTIVNGDPQHASFDNMAFLDKNTLLVAEDRGDTLHKQLNFLDSLWSFDLRKSLGSINANAKRLEAQGRDAESFADVQKKEATPPVPDQNDGDNEVTGIHVSDGATSIGGILGTDDPAWTKGTRIFVTQQHGENITFELTKKQK